MAPRTPLSTRIRSALRQPQSRLLRRPHVRPSSSLPPKPPAGSSSPTPNPSDRITKILSRLPRPLQKYTSRLRAAPVSHITAFLILHELTAIVPLFALFGLFHYYVDVGPVEGWMRGHYGSYVAQGTERFEKYFRRKGWFGFGQEEEGAVEGRDGGDATTDAGVVGEGRVTGEGRGEDDGQARYEIVVEVALAYAITKALLPLRIVGSVWATPWFAGVLVRLRKLARPAP